MKYDHIIKESENLQGKCFHLSCGFYTTTYFLFEKAKFSVAIDCNGTLTFYTLDEKKIETLQVKRMTEGRGCYMDVMITTEDERVTFQFPDYIWIDHYPHCDGESDRWSTKITGVCDEIVYPTVK